MTRPPHTPRRRGACVGARAVALAAFAALCLGAAPAGAEGARAPDWREVAPDNLLLIETSRGSIIVELRPDMVPRSVERVKTLARLGVYDGLLFHRVIDGFVDQTGNPNNHDGGVSALPDLAPEFDTRLAPGAVAIAARRAGMDLGFVGALPVAQAGKIAPDGKRRTWALYCAGVAGMGRQAAPDTANSEIFFMRAPARRLDREYAAFGRTLVGLDVVRTIAVGVPPPHPDLMVRVRVVADIPLDHRPRVEALNEGGALFRRRVETARRERGADFSPCDVDVSGRTVR